MAEDLRERVLAEVRSALDALDSACPHDSNLDAAACSECCNEAAVAVVIPLVEQATAERIAAHFERMAETPGIDPVLRGTCVGAAHSIRAGAWQEEASGG